MLINTISILLNDKCDRYKNNMGSFIQRRRRNKKQRRYIISNLIRPDRRKVSKVQNYMDVVDKYCDDTFKSHFRLTRECFRALLEELETNINPAERRPKIPVEKALLMTLWGLGNLNSYREISDRFGVSKGATVSTILFICCELCKMSKKYIKWPSRNEAEQVIAKFNCLRGRNSFPNVIGCLDGMHIPIPAPSIDPGSYYNRKGFHSLLLQGICDSRCKFIDVFFGIPGSSHDASVWTSSSICCKFENNELDLPADCHLLADSAYPLRKYIMVPYKDNGFLDEKQVKFNKKLSSTRIVIEQAFDLLKSRFRRLKYLNLRTLSNAKYFVLAAIVLHNYIIDHDHEGVNLINEEYEAESSDIGNDISESCSTLPGTSAGAVKRNYIKEIL